ncbi:MAG: cytochrome c biogenesis protein CcsA, partial [Verrucomicrobiota bacterium]|nr:cytochrome c biogenesis protein CcsA [Verrucomicrobiota bacterium]
MKERQARERVIIWPWVIIGLFTLLFAVKPMVSPPRAEVGTFDHFAFGELPVLLGGRIKPMDTIARNSLLQIAGQQKIALDGNGPNKEWGDLYELSQKGNGEGLTHQNFQQKFYKRPRKLHPTQWLMEVMMEPDVADKRFIFRIDHPELLSELQLEKVGVDKSGLRYYTFEQMQPFVMLLHKKRQVIGGKEAATRTPYERAAFKLGHALELYIQLRYSLQPNFLALSDFSNRLNGIADYAANLKDMKESAGTLKDHINSLKLDWPEEEPWPHIFSALEWHAKEGKDLEKWEVEGKAFNRGSVAEADTLGKLFFELERSGGITSEDLMAGKEGEVVIKIKGQLKQLQQRNQDNPGFASINHVIEDFLSVDEEAQGKIARYLLLVEGPLQTMNSRANLLMIPPAKRSGYAEGWEKTAESTLHDIGALGEISEPVSLYAQMSSAFDSRHSGEPEGDPKSFNQAVADYNSWLTKNGFQSEVSKGKKEHFFNTFAPFARAQGIYVIALLLACFSWLKMSRGLINTAFYLIGLAFVLHTAGLIFRMILEGRPPVTNLYSSAVFVGWGAVLLGWILERIYRNGIGSCVAALVGFSTLIIASHYAKDGDTMEMLVAVLDTNLWLATHVVCITIGYSATFLAGFLAMVYVLRGVFTSSLEGETAKGLTRMVYGIICFATLFSFVGTVLGGIWADQSWGRFWGWDPKENGALLIVVWNAIILHCRWGGFVKDRGLMGLAIFGNVVTTWSWFGVNMLGSGLHSYGFTEGAFHSLRWFAVGQVLLMIAGAQPLS